MLKSHVLVQACLRENYLQLAGLLLPQRLEQAAYEAKGASLHGRFSSRIPRLCVEAAASGARSLQANLHAVLETVLRPQLCGSRSNVLCAAGNRLLSFWFLWSSACRGSYPVLADACMQATSDDCLRKDKRPGARLQLCDARLAAASMRMFSR